MQSFKPILLLIISLPPALACGPHWPAQGQYSFFDHRVVGNPLWSHCFRVHKGMDFQTFPQMPEKWDHKKIMEREWEDYQQQLGTKVPLAWMIFNAGQAEIEAELKKHADDESVTAALNYLLFTKKVAPFTSAPKYWSWQSPEPDQSQLPVLLETLREAVNQTQSPFLRMRYGYQLVRLTCNMGLYNESLDAHDKYVAGGKSKSIFYLSQGWKARALMLQGRRVEAAGTYCDIADQYPGRAHSARLSLKLMKLTDQEWNDLETGYTNAHKKANAVFYRAVLQKREYAASTLAKLVALEPGSDRTEALLVRMIHGIERYNMDTDHKAWFTETPAHDRYDALVELCAKTARRDDVRRPVLWSLAGSYLALLGGKIDKARVLYQQAEATGSDNANIKWQLAMQKFLLSFQQKREGLPLEQSDALAALLKEYVPMGYPLSNRKTYRSLLMLALHRMVASGDGMRSGMIICAAGFETYGTKVFEWGADDKALAELETMFGGDVSNFDRFLLEYSPLRDREAVIHYRAVDLVRREDYAQARTHLQRLPPDYYGLAAIRFSRENPEFVEEPKIETTDLPKFCDLMIQMQEQAVASETSDPKAAVKLHETLGNIKYTLERTHFPEIAHAIPRRKSWKPVTSFYDSPEAFYDMGEAKKLRTDAQVAFEARLDNFRRAEKHYRRIVELNADRELAAKACVLVQISRNQYLYHKVEPNSGNYAYFYKLAKEYGDTEFYKDFSQKCPPAKLFQ
ncbi:MAG: hypothetical protein QNK37_15995 [Acidobacteriota bacterium]|nr:hypothetical protein [Acidobacteriota bacterium]